MKLAWRPPPVPDPYVATCRLRSTIIVARAHAGGLPRRRKTGDAAFDEAVVVVALHDWVLGLLDRETRSRLQRLVVDHRFVLHDGQLQASLSGLVERARRRLVKDVDALATRLDRGSRSALKSAWRQALSEPQPAVRDRLVALILRHAAASPDRSWLVLSRRELDGARLRDMVPHVTRGLAGQDPRLDPAGAEALLQHLVDHHDAHPEGIAALAALIAHASPSAWLDRLVAAASWASESALRALSRALVDRLRREPSVAPHATSALHRVTDALPHLAAELAELGFPVDLELLERPWPDDALRRIYRALADRDPQLGATLALRLDAHPAPAALARQLGRIAGPEALPALRPLTRGIFRGGDLKAAARAAVAAIEARHPIEHLRGALSEAEVDAGLTLVDRE
ncbi:MAG: hypothetical protein IT385_02125 [Deltaproteobacteria bacterium]|nr:hypothetical protein [Deltaproteobacteria bacterium]